MTARALALTTLLLAVGCAPSNTAQLADATAGVAGAPTPVAAPAAPEPIPPDALATEAEPTPASAVEITEICRVYRDALRSRWDDQQTREAVRGLSLSSDMASAWQRQLTDGDADQALSASRAVVDAAALQDLASTCEPLAGLVAVAESMRDVPSRE